MDKFMKMPNLQDGIANFAYAWALKLMIPPPAKLLDIGSRKSGFPAWAAKLGYEVCSVERDPEFIRAQLKWQKDLDVQFDILGGVDVRKLNWNRFDIATSFCALQHSAQDDVECYKHVARITNKQIFITTEFTPTTGYVQEDRADGAMRVYSPYDVVKRIITPIKEASMWNFSDPTLVIQYVKFDFPTLHAELSPNWTGANMVFLSFTR